MGKRSKRDELGLSGELYIYLLVSRLFPHASVVHQPGYTYGDILIKGDDGLVTKLEIKTANRNKRGNHQFNLRKYAHTDVSHSDIAVLIALDGGSVTSIRVIPTYELAGKQQVTLVPNSRLYAGFIDRFDLLT